MYASLGSAFFEMAGGLQEHAVSLERVVDAHRRRCVVLCMSPAQIQYLEKHADLGRGARLVLASMVRRSADYRAGAARASRTLYVEPDISMPTDFRINANGRLDVRLRYLADKLDQSSPSLYVEHVENDRRVVELIFRLFCIVEDITDELVIFNPVHGGGGTIADVLRAAHPRGLNGLGLADRDLAPEHPQVCKPGGTAESASQALFDLNSMPFKQFGYCVNEPMFGFLLTHSRTIEGYVGPHMLEVYFENNVQARRERGQFTRAYSNFPHLTDDQMFIWAAKNLKDGGVPPQEIASSVTARGGQVDASITSLGHVPLAKIPQNCTRWLGDGLDSRYRKAIVSAFESDLRLAPYRAAVEELFSMVWDLLAADQRMRLS